MPLENGIVKEEIQEVPFDLTGETEHIRLTVDRVTGFTENARIYVR